MSLKENIYIKKEQLIVGLTKFGRGKSKKERVEKRYNKEDNLPNNRNKRIVLTHYKKKIMASGPITSWQTEGEKVEVVTDFISLDSNITVDGDCSHEIKRHLLLERKAIIT